MAKAIICPVCKMPTGFYIWPSVEPGGLMVKKPYELLAYRYPGDPDHISPRCSRCFDKAMKGGR